jgi:POT family proton-dependent oligopeptide transporter
MIANITKSRLTAKGIFSIFSSEILDRLNYYGLQSIFVLYFIGFLNLPTGQSYLTYGIYVSLSYTSSILGGMIADKVLGHFYAVLLGIILIAIANSIFCVTGVGYFYLGLSVMIMGAGLLKPNNPNLLGDFYQGNSLERDKMFSYFYLCINIGSIVGPLLYGFFYSHELTRVPFIISGVFALFMACWLMRAKSLFNKELTVKVFRLPFLIVGIILLIALCDTVMMHSVAFNYFIGIAAIGLLFLAIYYLRIAEPKDRGSVLTLFLTFIGNVLYLAAFLQIYSAVTVFINSYLNRDFFGFAIPTAWFSSIQPLFIIIMVPFLAIFWNWLGRKGVVISPHNKVILGLLISAMAFVVFGLAAKICQSANETALGLILAANALLAIAELCVIPVTMSLVNILAPDKLKGSLMGTFYFCFTFSGFFTGIFAKLLPVAITTPVDYTYFFFKIAFCLIFLAAVPIFMLKYCVKKWI